MDDNTALVSHLSDCARRAERIGARVYTGFLDPAQAGLARAAANAQRVPLELFGGYADAERVVAGFGWDDGAGAWPVVALEARWDARFSSCEHRDILGSLMALGVERECFGDILIDADGARAIVFALERMQSYLEANWTQAGRAGLRVRRLDDAGELPAPRGETRRVTVQSPRLDAVLAAVYNLSRAEAQRVVRSGRVRVSFLECDAIDRLLEPGDVVSARGLGRFRLLEEHGRTRRDRLGLAVFKYEGK